MSRSEDYLDNLLTSVTDRLSEYDEDFEQNRESLRDSYQTQNDLPSKTQSALDEIREENFLREFEDELHKGGAEDSFLREFERELNEEADDAYASSGMDDYMTQMGEIADDTKTGFDDVTMKIDTMPQEDDSLESLFGEESVTQNLENSAGSGLDAFMDSSAEQALDDIMGAGADSALDELMGAGAGGLDEPAGDGTDGSLDGMQENTLDAGTDMGEDGISQMANEQEKPAAAPEGMEGLEDIFGDIFDEETASLLEELGGEMADDADITQAVKPREAEPKTEAADSLTEILNASDDEALSELDQMLASSDGDDAAAKKESQDTIPSGPDFSFEESVIDTGDSDKKRKKEKNSNSPFAKLSRMLFGTPEELNPEAAAEYEAAKAAMGNKEELDPKARKEKKKQEKELKKQQKQEEAEKKKQEKEAAKAEKAAKKAAKPKKEKKPKKKDAMPKEPPLPKVPVMMMWGIALSMLVLIILGTVLLGYSIPVSESKEAFDKGDYVTAYAKLKSIEVKPEDEELLHAATALASVQTELDAYTALMELKQYEMALDSLIRGYGRCAIHSADAEEWGVSSQLTEMENKFDLLLREQFDVSKRQAKKLYKIKKRSEYTLELHKILDKLGLDYKG